MSQAQRASNRTWPIVLVAVVMCLLATVAAWLPWALRSPLGVTTSARPTIPSGMDLASPLVASVRSAPAGAAIALLEADWSLDAEHYAVGAYANRVRSVPQVSNRTNDEFYSARLSPDGRRIAVGGRAVDGQRGISLLDLTTGASQSIGTARDYADVLAWSPDSSLLAYLDGDTNLQLLDVDAGTHRRVDIDAGGLGREGDFYVDHTGFVAFSPDGESLAVDLGETIRLVPLSGAAQETEIEKDADHVLTGPAAWSPDGSLLALYSEESTDDGEVLAATLTFQPVPGHDAPDAKRIVLRDPYTLDLVGWASPTEPITAEIGWDDGAVVAHHLSDTARRTLMSLDMDVYRVELATALLPAAGARGAVHDAGRTPDAVFVGISAALALVTLLGGGLLGGGLILITRPRRTVASSSFGHPAYGPASPFGHPAYGPASSFGWIPEQRWHHGAAPQPPAAPAPGTDATWQRPVGPGVLAPALAAEPRSEWVRP